jgi:beta-aspartyl-dipeptidase (metallo-type)
LVEYKREGVDLTHVTVSSDGYGSFPEYNDQGQLVGYGTMSPGNILATLRTLILDHHWTIEEAFRLATRTTADYLKLPGKGRLLVGYDADILVLNSLAERLEVEYVWGRGQALKTPQWTAHGMFPCV